MLKLNVILVILSILLLSACSSSQETTQTEEKQDPEIYVFDDVTEVEADTAAQNETVEMPAEQEEALTGTSEPAAPHYFVQVGAFTTRDRAETFIRDNSSKIEQEMSISYSDDVKLFVIQLPPYATKPEAEAVRDRLWKLEPFKDAFIVTK